VKEYSESRSIDPRILDLGTRWRCVVSFTYRPLYPQGKSPWHQLDRRLGAPHLKPKGNIIYAFRLVREA